MKTIGIVGSRRRNSVKDRIACERAFKKILEDTPVEWSKTGRPEFRIVSGGCPQGADSFAEAIAKNFQVPIMIWYAEWGRLGNTAGFIRNTFIAEDCDILIALPAEDRTGGTEDTIEKAIALGKEVIYV